MNIRDRFDRWWWSASIRLDNLWLDLCDWLDDVHERPPVKEEGK